MKNEKETKRKLLDSAKKEFLEKGYMQASLRSICKNAGVTTGALYFFFQDKEDLFASLVEEPLGKLYEVMAEHYQEEREQAEKGLTSKEDFSGDLEAARMIIHYMYQYYEEFQLVLTKSQGSKFEQSIDYFVNITEKHYRYFADVVSKRKRIEPVSDYMIHWIAHMHIDLFVHLLTHEKSEEAAMKYMKSIIQYLFSGWNGLVQ